MGLALSASGLVLTVMRNSWTFGSVKYYMYHVLALQSARALEMESSTVTGSVPLSSNSTSSLTLPTRLLYTVADLQSVSQSKRKSETPPQTVMHLCGNKWCMNSGHFFVGSKTFNDQQGLCHWGLHHALSLEQYLGVQEHFCKHQPRCWAVPYSGVLDLAAAVCETGLPGVVVEEDDPKESTSEGDRSGSFSGAGEAVL